MMAPTEPKFSPRVFMNRTARARPTTSLNPASMTWEMPVGRMSKCPWK